ncbi:thiamine phosphate synthase [Sulfurimonas sp. HSL-1656]|uniref:thiamine phosphate synthase n=1 Tax=Thiomicrolovo subterrani TaxID=3131934 RepID=UPI0031FA1F95
MPFFAYLITDGCYGAATPGAFAKRLETLFEAHSVDYALYRDKANPDYARFAAVFVDGCRAHGVKAILHQDTALALSLGADGVHLTSTQFDAIKGAKEAGLFTVISAHSPVELAHAAAEGADAATYSPIFESPGKGEPKGLDDLNETAGKIDLPVIALGGIVSPDQISAVRAAGAAGFASIRYFINSAKESFCSK